MSAWENLNRPFDLSELMWNHMPHMLAAMGAKRMSWPTLSAQDLSDLLVYLRNLPDTRDFAPGIEIAADASGAALFRSKGCEKCHGSAASCRLRQSGDAHLNRRDRRRNVGPRSARAWLLASAASPPFAPGEMGALLSYLWARQFFEDAGDPARGRRVFTAKRCVECHATGAAPKLPAAGRLHGATVMVAVLWHHGPAMLGRMKARGVPWPRLEAADMSGLIAFLNSSKKGEAMSWFRNRPSRGRHTLRATGSAWRERLWRGPGLRFSWLFLLPMHMSGHANDPYIGLLAFVALPLLFFTGLITSFPSASPLGRRHYWGRIGRRGRPRSVSGAVRPSFSLMS